MLARCQTIMDHFSLSEDVFNLLSKTKQVTSYFFNLLLIVRDDFKCCFCYTWAPNKNVIFLVICFDKCSEWIFLVFCFDNVEDDTTTFKVPCSPLNVIETLLLDLPFCIHKKIYSMTLKKIILGVCFESLFWVFLTTRF